MILALVVLAGCSSSTVPAKYGAQYVRIVAPANSVLTRFQNELSSLGKHPARADVAKAAAPVISAIQGVDQNLVRAPWPSGVDTDIKAEVAADAAIRADLSAAGAQPNWQARLMSDEATAGAKARSVRAALHLARG